ncbi:uncharacterized protein LOC123520137 [Portunus trituberculatus]|uniref:Uncharacterized protein n=1 Tax=Portunus trituberculatus TaxID=210409 RepID=A0A5B7IE73_PORTR|nr:uncharacterized protein LOC123520137 [Portunus trituberculatus]MPC80139.1 hypothetical protein [Portunus trituberculatus]
MLAREAVDGGVVAARRRFFDRQETTESNFSGISCISGTEDILLAGGRAPFGYRAGLRRKSLEGGSLLETALCFDSEVDLEEKRMLDSHNIDTPTWLTQTTLEERYGAPTDIPPNGAGLDLEAAGGPSSHFSQARRYVGRRLGHGHHKRHPSPIRRRPREEESGKGSPPITVNVTTSSSYPENFYPIFLPMDQAFKAKYVFTNKKGKTLKEKTYLFLEHPCGWCCFFYHFIV